VTPYVLGEERRGEERRVDGSTSPFSDHDEFLNLDEVLRDIREIGVDEYTVSKLKNQYGADYLQSALEVTIDKATNPKKRSGYFLTVVKNGPARPSKKARAKQVAMAAELKETKLSAEQIALDNEDKRLEGVYQSMNEKQKGEVMAIVKDLTSKLPPGLNPKAENLIPAAVAEWERGQE
jgi:hypothetical protein